MQRLQKLDFLVHGGLLLSSLLDSHRYRDDNRIRWQFHLRYLSLLRISHNRQREIDLIDISLILLFPCSSLTLKPCIGILHEFILPYNKSIFSCNLERIVSMFFVLFCNVFICLCVCMFACLHFQYYRHGKCIMKQRARMIATRWRSPTT